MIICLKCGKRSTSLELPAMPAEVTDKLSKLRDGREDPGPVFFYGIFIPTSNLYPYIRDANVENETDLQKLNELAARIESMSPVEQHLFSGALELDCSGGLGNALHIAENLGQYEILPMIKKDEDLGRFLVGTSWATGKFSFPKSVQPYLNYDKIGAEHRNALGGVYTQHGLVMHREEAQREAAMLVTLKVSDRSFPLTLPAAEEQLSEAKRALGIEDYAQAAISGVEYAVPGLERQIPAELVTVEDANKLALRLRQMNQGEMKIYRAVLEAEGPSTFAEALDIAMDIDGYELITDSEQEYGRKALRRMAENDEQLEAMDEYTDLKQLGRGMMEEDGVRKTQYGMVRRLSGLFPPEQEIGQTMC